MQKNLNPTDVKNFITIKLYKVFNSIEQRKPAPEELYTILVEELEKEFSSFVSLLVETEKQQNKYAEELLKFAELIDFKGDMLLQLKQRLKEKN